MFGALGYMFNYFARGISVCGVGVLVETTKHLGSVDLGILIFDPYVWHILRGFRVLTFLAPLAPLTDRKRTMAALTGDVDDLEQKKNELMSSPLPTDEGESKEMFKTNDPDSQFGKTSASVASYGGQSNFLQLTKKISENKKEKKREEIDIVMESISERCKKIEMLRLRNEINALLTRMHACNSEDIAVNERMKKSDEKDKKEVSLMEMLMDCGGGASGRRQQIY